MKIWKPFAKYKSDRQEWCWHADFMIDEYDTLYSCFPKELLAESPPKGKIYKCHIKIALELFDAEE